MKVAEPLHVGQYLVAASAGGGARRCKSIADEHDIRLPVALADVEIHRADLDVGDFDVAGERPQPRQHRKQRLLPVPAHLAQPRIIHIAIDEEIGAHHGPDGKQ